MTFETMQEDWQYRAGEKISIQVTLGYPGSRVSDILIGDQKVQVPNEVLFRAMADNQEQDRNTVDFLREVLAFYADPETYHAIYVSGDRPCGLFADDFSDDHNHPDYDRPMSGKRARDALRATLNYNREVPELPQSRDAFVGVLAALAASISLLEKGGKKAAASGKMFEQMLSDYRGALERGREHYLAAQDGE